MNTAVSQRAALLETVCDNYGTLPDAPWEKHPDDIVLRHGSNRKWYALIMNIRADRLIPGAKGNIDILNIKCDSLISGSLLNEAGFFPAYHMSKKCWLTVALDGSVDIERINTLVDMSYNLTSGKPPARRPSGPEKAGVNSHV